MEESCEQVLSDLFLCTISGAEMLDLNSDYEMMQGFTLFTDMLSSNNKSHEALFDLGRINYAQGRYDIAEKCLLRAYEVGRDFSYRIWLAFTQL